MNLKKIVTGVNQKIREVKTFGDFIEEACVKATNNNMKRPKEKHVRTLIHFSGGKDGVSIERILKLLYETLHSTSNWNVVLKGLELFHSLIQRGFDRFTFVLAKIQLKQYAFTEGSKGKGSPLRKKKYNSSWPPERKNFFSLSDWEDKSNIGSDITPFIHRYARYVQTRLRLYSVTKIRHFRVSLNLHEKNFRGIGEIISLVEPFQRLLQRFLDMQIVSFFGHCNATLEQSEIVQHCMNLLLIDSLVIYKVLCGLMVRFLKMFFKEERGGKVIVNLLQRGLQAYERHIVQMDRMLDIYGKIKRNIHFKPLIVLPELKSMKGRNIIQTMKKKIKEIRALENVIEENLDDVFDDSEEFAFTKNPPVRNQPKSAPPGGQQSPRTPTKSTRGRGGNSARGGRGRGGSKSGSSSPISYRAKGSPNSSLRSSKSSSIDNFSFKAPPSPGSGGRRRSHANSPSSSLKMKKGVFDNVKKKGGSRGTSPVRKQRRQQQQQQQQPKRRATGGFDDDDDGFFTSFDDDKKNKKKKTKQNPGFGDEDDDFFSIGGGGKKKKKEKKAKSSGFDEEDEDFFKDFDDKKVKSSSKVVKKERDDGGGGFDDDEDFFQDFDNNSVPQKKKKKKVTTTTTTSSPSVNFEDDDFFEKQTKEIRPKKKTLFERKEKSGFGDDDDDDDFFSTDSFGKGGGDEDDFFKGGMSNFPKTSTPTTKIAEVKNPIGGGGVNLTSDMDSFFSAPPPSSSSSSSSGFGGFFDSSSSTTGLGMPTNDPMMNTPPKIGQQQPSMDAFFQPASPVQLHDDFFRSMETQSTSIPSSSGGGGTPFEIKNEGKGSDEANPFDDLMKDMFQ